MEGSNKAPHDIENPHIQLATSMLQELDGLTPLSASCCIYKVPEELRCVNKKAYTPQAVYRSDSPWQGRLRRHGRTQEEVPEIFSRSDWGQLGSLCKQNRGQEEELRSCYAHTIGLSSDEFVRIILVDAMFIIELLLRDGGHLVPESNDRIFDKPWLINFIKPDMFLLENQLPFFILENLFATAEVPAMMPSVFDLSYHFCKKFRLLFVNRDVLGTSSSSEAKHFVDLIRTINLQTDQEENSKNQGPFETLAIPSMTKLQAGIKFKVRSNKNLFDICFKDGILEIPSLTIYDGTEYVLRNIIAFEQCHCSDNNYFIDYITVVSI